MGWLVFSFSLIAICWWSTYKRSSWFPWLWYHAIRMELYSYLSHPHEDKYATLMSDLQPIRLCSVMYKTISKILASRLKRFLSWYCLSSHNQHLSLISVNITLAHEAIHSLRTHDFVTKNFMAAKIDISKYFDKVEWNYLKALLLSLGFHFTWVPWIMACVSTMKYSVLINGESHGFISPERGLRQCNPISLLLFVFFVLKVFLI